MTLIKLCFTPALLLLLLPPLALAYPLSQPPPEGPASDSCVSQARSLLHNISAALAQKELFTGFSCLENNMVLYMENRTAAVCTPQGSTCSGGGDYRFDQDLCVTQIGEDLSYYYKHLTAQPANAFLSAGVLPSLRGLLTNCWSLPLDSRTTEAAADSANSYDDRLNLCKLLRGFQVRAITINRALGYINSGEHMK